MTVLLLALSLLQTPASSDQTVYPVGPGVAAPQAINRPTPRYTDAAREAGVQGVVMLTGIVEADGRVSNIRIQRSLDAGLDQEAIKAFEQWRFTPGTKDGQPVRVQVTVEMSFNMRGGTIPPTPPTAIAVFRRVEQNGTTTAFEIPNERFLQLPSWDPNVVRAPSLAAGDALRIATEWVGRVNPIAEGYTLLAVSLRRFPVPTSNRWFYVFDFTPANHNPQVPTSLTTAVVLLDGSIVEPHR